MISTKFLKEITNKRMKGKVKKMGINETLLNAFLCIGFLVVIGSVIFFLGRERMPILLKLVLVFILSFSALIVVSIFGGDTVNVLSDGFQSVRSVLVGDVGNFSISDAVDRISMPMIIVLVPIAVIIFLKRRKEKW